ncbi:MAG TPA: tetratricopeptide repeat protein [Candidatus Binatia bacterium]|nr:tetratricopeptide repeat protein [Candidatus Binatia bacterium]
MRALQTCHQQSPLSSTGNSCFRPAADLRLWFLVTLCVCQTQAQDAGSAATEFYGKGTAVTIVVHDASGNPIRAGAMVKLFRAGTIPAGQAETERGRAELVVNDLGDFTAVVAAAGYASVQKDFSVGTAGKTQVDVYLSALSVNSNGAPGRPILAPKAKKAVDEGLQALSKDNLGEAQKQASKAISLAPGHPDVLYLQGVVFLKQRDWAKAREVLEKATQVDPTHANALAALGMALCDEGKYETAIGPLEKALQFNRDLSWDARWTLAEAYYRQARYDQALEMSQTALVSSHGKAPEIQLLVAQSLSAVGRYEDAAQTLREFLRDHSDRRDAATARRWLDGLAANGKISAR